MAAEGYRENAADAAALDVIARFALAQEELGLALEHYLDAKLSPQVKSLVWKRLRLSDDERLGALVALAHTLRYPLHEHGYRTTFRAVKDVRDRLAHGGLPLPGSVEHTGEPGLMTLGASERDAVRFYSLSALEAVGDDARWLTNVAWRVRSMLSQQLLPKSVRVPSDLPSSSVLEAPVSREGWGPPPVCPNGHGNVVGVGTLFGDAWLCGHCSNIRVRDESILIGSRAVLDEAPSTVARRPDTYPTD